MENTKFHRQIQLVMGKCNFSLKNRACHRKNDSSWKKKVDEHKIHEQNIDVHKKNKFVIEKYKVP